MGNRFKRKMLLNSGGCFLFRYPDVTQRAKAGCSGTQVGRDSERWPKYKSVATGLQPGIYIWCVENKRT